MRVIINARSILLKKRTGIGRYTYNLLDNLGKIDHDNEYLLHVPKKFFDFKRQPPDFSRYKNFKKKKDFFQLGAGQGDVYHLPSPDSIGPYRGKLVVTIHDLIHKAYPQSHTPQTIDLTEKYLGAILPQAHRIICISDHTRQDLHRFYQVPLERSCVVYNGVDHDVFYRLSPQERPQAARRLKEQLGIEAPYILYVGTIEPRKNLKGLLEAFAALVSPKKFHGRLVVVGMKGWMMENVGSLIQSLGLQDRVLFTGFVSDAQLREIYNLAEIFVFPSFYEGFGFPILEAFACGAPVLASQASSCPEIAAAAAVMVDPHDNLNMAQAMERVWRDETLKESLSKAGLRRAQEFSFLNMARETLDVYKI